MTALVAPPSPISLPRRERDFELPLRERSGMRVAPCLREETVDAGAARAARVV